MESGVLGVWGLGVGQSPAPVALGLRLQDLEERQGDVKMYSS